MKHINVLARSSITRTTMLLTGWVLFLFLLAPQLARAQGFLENATERPAITGGHVVAINDVPVPAGDPGILVALEVEEGDSVDEDQLLARIDDREAVMSRDVAKYRYKAAKRKAENEISVEAAVALQGVREADLESMLNANKDEAGSFSETEVRRARLDWQRAGLQIELARHENLVAAQEALAQHAQYLQAKAMIERRKIKAPFPGVVMEISRDKGEWVNAGDPILRLVRMDQLRVQGHVSKFAFHWRDVIGRPVEITIELPGGGEETVNATIGYAAASVQDDETFRIWADIPNRRDGNSWLIGPGLRATMKLQ